MVKMVKMVKIVFYFFIYFEVLFSNSQPTSSLCLFLQVENVEPRFLPHFLHGRNPAAIGESAEQGIRL